MPMFGRPATFYPSILRLYQRGGLGTTMQPWSHSGNCTGACHACPHEGAFSILVGGNLSSGTSQPTGGDSFLIVREIVVFQLGVFDLAVTFSLVVSLAYYEVLTTLPLGWHPW